MSQIMNVVNVVVAAILLIIVVGLIMALPTMWLWNGCLVDAVQGVREIGWLQAWGLNMLFGIMFKPCK